MPAHRVAFVLSGQTRSFTDAVTRNSIRQNAIDALCPSSAECAAVLFLCAELGECRAVAAAARAVGVVPAGVPGPPTARWLRGGVALQPGA